MVDRRDFFKLSAKIATVCSVPFSLQAEETLGREQFLWVIRRDTGEEIKTTSINDRSLEKFCNLARDLHVGVSTEMDPNLMIALSTVQSNLFGMGIIKPLMIVSGYRTPRTNARTEGAAKNSFHMKGKAVDFYVEGLEMSMDFVGTLATQFQAGGVGFYPGRSFTHLDTGNFRTWGRAL